MASAHRGRRPFWMPFLMGAATFLLWQYIFSSTVIIRFYNTTRLLIINHTSKGTHHRHVLDRDIFMDFADNYFQKVLKESRGELLINTSKCQIPSLNPFSPEVIGYVKPGYPECTEFPRITHIDHHNIVINETELAIRGYSFQDISCCYRTIERVEQNLTHYSYSRYPDGRYRFSNSCYPMGLSTEPITGYIVVNCTTLNATSGKNHTFYEKVHAFVKFSKREDERLYPKISYWEKYATNPFKSTNRRDLPPSVLMLGFDSTSRLNFHRQMRKTAKLLQKLGSIEMLGYTKVGVNTCPNLYSILTAHTYSIEELENIYCSPGYDKPLDNITFLWNHFSNQSYATGFFEDDPDIAIFNYGKMGFIGAPTDIYWRPWMKAAYDVHMHKQTDECLGYELAEDIALKYVRDVTRLLHGKMTPYFILMFLTDATHHDLSALQMMDDPVSELIDKMHKSKMLENTILIVFSDHGFRKGSIGETTVGWFEDKLPVMYIRLPEALQRRFPEWKQALEYNSRQLSSPYDIHATLMDVVKLNSKSPNYLNSMELRGKSLFKKLPSRNCNESHIPTQYCVCLPNMNETLDMSVVQFCVKTVIERINRRLPPYCASLTATEVTAVFIVDKTKSWTESTTDYTTIFEASPTDFEFEALVRYDNYAGKVKQISKVQRTNKKNQNTTCLKENELHLELFCECVY